MRFQLPHLAKSPAALDDLMPFSRTVIIRRRPAPNTPSPSAGRIVSAEPAPTAPKPKPLPPPPPDPPIDASRPDYRENDMQIQMLSRSLYQQIFGSTPATRLDTATANRFRSTLLTHGIRAGDSTPLSDIDARLKLPPLRGRSLTDHFERIATDQSQPYRQLANSLATLQPAAMPTVWRLQPGWTHYCPGTGVAASVPYPDDAALVFDIENCVREGAAPTLACALGASGWYSWCSDALFELRSRDSRPYRPADLIPLESAAGNTSPDAGRARQPRLIVGHNVSYDRARIKEQYWPTGSRTRFLDTMSLHVCCSGVTSYQRAMLKSRAPLPAADRAWSELGSLNGLSDVHRLYWPELGALDKQQRNVFVDGTLADIREDFQRLCTYCAGDVAATQRVLARVWPMFAERFPHAATLAGMLELGAAYLPVTDGWRRYVQAAHLCYDDLNIEARRVLEQRANRACRLGEAEQWRRDIWMWDEDWSVQVLKLNGSPAMRATKAGRLKMEKEERMNAAKRLKGAGAVAVSVSPVDEAEFQRLDAKFARQRSMACWMPARRPLLPGYPAWYRGLCEKRPSSEAKGAEAAPVWQPGPVKIGTGMQVTPKLLSLCWEGYPLHYVKEHGWGFMVPIRGGADDVVNDDDGDGEAVEKAGAAKAATVPLAELVQRCSMIECSTLAARTKDDADDAFRELVEMVELNLSRKQYPSKYRDWPDKTAQPQPRGRPITYTGAGVWCDHQIAPGVWFFKLPHKDGAGSRVGNPMAKDFLAKFADNVLTGGGRAAERVIRIAGQLSYWRNNRDRIGGQTVVWLDAECTRGAIVPQVVVCGTLTRRASEPTWMTASNAQRERIGSELRGMVQAPAGYRFVGADVDSQELWIAAVLGDAAATAPLRGGCHGATPFGWMTLNGQKADGTDMHSVTASAVGISRDHAKVINYARIYGAGQQFAQRLLRQFNPTLTEAEARAKAMRMFALTKGKRLWRLREDWRGGEFEDRPYTRYEATRVAALCGRTVTEMFGRPQWSGGTESAMFNRLEEIAGEPEPRTPFLGGRLTRPLEPAQAAAAAGGGEVEEDRFLPTRVNWVVQSGAVDFLHLMLVCMRWLMGEEAVRFSLSFHDEVRYLVREEDAARAAVAMHVTNLLVRAFCVQRLGMTDLPQSVAFFQAVEIDQVLRKESHADYVTPSNPHGLMAGYGVPPGRSVGITAALQDIAGDEDMSRWPWHRRK